MLINRISLSKNALLGIVLWGVAAVGFASDNATVYFLSNPGYAGVDLGFGGLRIDDQTGLFNTPHYQRNYSVMSTTGSGDSYVYRVFGGYLFPMTYKFQFGPEISYTSYSSKTFTLSGVTDLYVPVSESDTYSGYAVEVLANATYHNSAIFYMFTKMGLAFVTQNLTYDVESSDPNFDKPSSNTSRAVLPSLHIGMGFQFAPSFGLEFSGFSLLGGSDTSPEKYATATTQANKVAAVFGFLVGFHVSF